MFQHLDYVAKRWKKFKYTTLNLRLVRAIPRYRSLPSFYFINVKYTGMPTSHVMYELCQQLNKDNNDMLWLAIVGVTYHYIENHIPQNLYDEIVLGIQTWVIKIIHIVSCKVCAHLILIDVNLTILSLSLAKSV